MRRLALLLCLLSVPALADEAYVPVKSTNFNFTTTNTRITENFGTNIEGVRVNCVTACYVAFGATPDATAATGHMVPAGVPVVFRVNGGNVSVIQVSATGRVSLTELSK